MKLRAIPQIPNHLDPQLRAVLLALKENIEMLAGQRGSSVQPLPVDADLASATSKINELVSRLS